MASSGVSYLRDRSLRNIFGGEPLWLSVLVAALLIVAPVLNFILIPKLLRFLGRSVGYYLSRATAPRRAMILAEDDDEPIPKSGTPETTYPATVKNAGIAQAAAKLQDWQGVIGFFHPFCNSGGGGERVLWAAIRATQERYPKAHMVVYTGDHDVDKETMLERVQTHFNIDIHAPSITFLYLTTRPWVLASVWPRFTLLGQSFGSLVLAYDAFSLLVPDIFIDTMGYAFSLGFCKLLFPHVPTGAYVHYPTISTDMLSSLDTDPSLGQGVNAGQGRGLMGIGKKLYWEFFAKLYTWMGSTIDVVMTNSSWTQAHIKSLWGPAREKSGKQFPDATPVFPPVAVEELEQEIEVSEASEAQREKVLVYVAQFRPEKNHQLIIEAFAEFKASDSEASKDAKLVLIGSVRDHIDSTSVYELRLLLNELKIKDSVEFHLDASWPEILDWLRRASIGVNGMWNEHFGIGVVEYQAAGLIAVVNDSGGPRRDIVVPVDGAPTGFHASTVEEYADGFEKALSIADPLAMRLRARKSAQRFGETQFAQNWVEQLDRLVLLQQL